MHLVESVNAEPRFVKANYKIIYGFSSAIRISTPKPCVVQGSTIYFKVKSERKQNYQNRKIIDATCSEGGCVGGGGYGGVWVWVCVSHSVMSDSLRPMD